MKKVRISVRVSPEFDRLFAEAAERQCRTKSNLLQALVEKHVFDEAAPAASVLEGEA